MRRRALLASLAGLSTLSGCSGLVSFDDSQPSSRTPRATATPTETPSQLPYRSDGPTVEPRGFTVENQSDRERYVTVVVEDDGETVFVESTTVPAATGDDVGRADFSGLVASRGVYRVVVETADGERTEQGWLVSEEAGRALNVFLQEDGIESFQLAYCRPDCEPLSQGTAAVDVLPYWPSGSPENWRMLPDSWTGIVALLNPGSTARRATVALSLDGESILDYRYDVPPGVQMAIPATKVPGTYDLRVGVEGESAEYEWHLPEDDVVPIDVTGSPTVACTPNDADGSQEGLRIERIRNDDSEAHSVTLRVTGDSGSREATYDVGAEGTTTIGAELRATDRLSLELELETGAKVTATWTLCPAASRTYSVGIDTDGTLALLDRGNPVVTSDSEWNGGDGGATWTSNQSATETPDDE